MIPHIETNRLKLRAFCQNDVGDYLGLVGDAGAMRYIGTGRTLNAEEAWVQIATILGHWQLRGYGLWALEDKQTGDLVGRAGLYNPDGWPGLEVGWALIPRFQGQGFATEAGAAALNFAFGEVGADAIISCIQPGNAPSIAVAERLGQRYVRNDLLQGIRVHIYGVDRATWESHTAAT